MDIEFRLLTWTSLICQFVYPVVGEDIGVNRVEGGNYYVSLLRVALN